MTKPKYGLIQHEHDKIVHHTHFRKQTPLLRVEGIAHDTNCQAACIFMGGYALVSLFSSLPEPPPGVNRLLVLGVGLQTRPDNLDRGTNGFCTKHPIGAPTVRIEGFNIYDMNDFIHLLECLSVQG